MEADGRDVVRLRQLLEEDGPGDPGGRDRTRRHACVIYHWCSEAEWRSASDQYRPRDFERDGFVHCSFHHQVEATASRHDRGREDLVLLCIDETGLPMAVEDSYETGEKYPHVYGTIPVSSVVRILGLPPLQDGSFRLPPGTPFAI